MFDLISKLSIGKGLNITLIFFGVLVAPFWFLYQFNYNLYKEIEFSKFILLTLSIGIPVSLLMTGINSLIIGKPKEENGETQNEKKFLLMGVSSAFCGFAFYVPCIIKFWIVGLSERKVIELIIFIFLGAITYSIIYVIRGKVKMKSNAIKDTIKKT